MEEVMSTFDPSIVQISYTFNVQQVNLLLRGLGKLPLEEVELVHNGIRQVALQALSSAEAKAKSGEPSPDAVAP